MSKNLSFHLSDKVSLEMVYCHAGAFIMGTSDNDDYLASLEQPEHKVELTNGFWMSETPVTRRQLSNIETFKVSMYETSLDSPAAQYTWEEAIEICQMFSSALKDQLSEIGAYTFTLPTEAQWEYACRAGTTTKWYFGDDETKLGDYAWYKLSSKDAKLPAVKLKKPNAWGLYDFYGMVYEWCLDNFLIYSRIKQTINPVVVSDQTSATLDTRIVRGGCIDDAAQICSSAKREVLLTSNSENDLTGIRLVINDI